MTNTAFAPASAVRRLVLLVVSVAVTMVAIIAPVTASWASTGTGSASTTTGTTGTATAGQCQATSAVAQYPNGQIPLTVLCALVGTSNQYLRADAAYNFNRLSKAYAKQFGTPLCVTDSYRKLATQKTLFVTKPGLAAKPGTSNHGWGVATDLCGGVQNFGTAQHDWLFQNAPKFRWVHPTWAQATGSRPEPWHWEYAPRSNMVRDALGLPHIGTGYNGFQIAKPATGKKTTSTKTAAKASSLAQAMAVASGTQLAQVDDI